MLLVLAAIAITTVYSTYPIVVNFGNVLADSADSVLIVWILNQTIQKLPFGLLNIFESNIFYPNAHTLSYTVTLIPSAIISSPAYWLTNNPIAVSNFLTIFSQFSVILLCFLFFKDLTKSRNASLIAAIAFGLSQIRLHYLVHLQLFTLHFFIASIWMLYKFLDSKNKKYLYISFALIAAQALENILPVYWFGALALLNFKKAYIKAFPIFLIIASPVIYIYLKISNLHEFERSIRDAAHFSLGFEEIFTKFFSIGLFLSTFYIIYKKLLSKKANIFIIFAIICFVLALGPVLKFEGQTVKLFGAVPIPLPYSLFYYVIPGFKAFRTTSRWMIPFAFGLSAILAIGLAKLEQQKKYIQIILITILVIIGGSSMKNYVIFNNNIPNVYKWLENQKGEVVLELPAYGIGNDGAIIETRRMYYSLFHKKKLINGYSGFTPPSYDNLVKDLKNNPEKANFKADYVILDKNLDKNKHFSEFFENNEDFKLIYEDDKNFVYILNSPSL